MPELRARQLTKRFSGIAVVKDVDFTIQPGEMVGYLGPNGSGKTTTAKMLAGLLVPSSGRVEYGGHDIHLDPIGYRRELGFIQEEAFLYPFLSGREYLELIGRLREIPDRVRLPADIDQRQRHPELHRSLPSSILFLHHSRDGSRNLCGSTGLPKNPARSSS